MGINHTPGPWIVYGAPGNVWAPFDQENVANAYIADRDRETQSANARLIAAAPAMLAALRKISQGADCFTFNSDADVFRFVDMVAEIVAPVLARIDGAAPATTAPAPVAAPGFAAHALDTLKDCEAWFANNGDVDGVFFDDATMLDRVRESLALATPTAQPAGDDPAITAAANLSRAALVEAAGEALALQAPISEAGDHCASCGAEEGESHGAQCETRGFALGVDARRLYTGALRTVAGDDAAWLEATASRDGGEC